MITKKIVKHTRITNAPVKVLNGQTAFPLQDQGHIVLMSPHLLPDDLVCRLIVRAFDARETRGVLLVNTSNATDLLLWIGHLGTN